MALELERDDDWSEPVNSEMASTQWEGPLFIVGMPRSGTKLLRGLLSKHPRIRILVAETDFLPFFEEWIERHGNPVSADAFQRFARELQAGNYFNFRRKSTPFRWQEWRAACNGQYRVASAVRAGGRTPFSPLRSTALAAFLCASVAQYQAAAAV